MKLQSCSDAQTLPKILQSSAGTSFEGDAQVSDVVVAAIIHYYAFSGKEKAQQHLLAFSAIGLRTLIQNATGYKPDPKRRLTAEEIVELCCLPTPTSWEKRFPEEYYQHLSRLTGLVVEGTARPGYWAALTKELIYDYLPPGIYAQIRRCKVESGSWAKLHQYLSPIDGVDILEKHQRRVLQQYCSGSLRLENYL
jgi:P63C domain